MLRSSVATFSTLAFLPLIGLLAIGCAQGLNDPDGEDSSLGAGGAFSSANSTSSGFKTTSATTTVATTGNATTTVATTAVTSGSLSTTGSLATTTTGGGTCEALGDCGSCGNCAIAGQCAPEMNACEADQNCTALLDCLQNCTDQTCADGCATQYPGGQAGYTAFVSCIICQACPVTCDAAAMGGCGP